MSNQDQILYHIVNYLKSESFNNNVDVESLEVAIECLSEAVDYNTLENKFQAKNLPSLNDIYNKGLVSLTSSKVEEEENDSKIVKLIEMLNAKGYFNGCTKGSIEYNKRLNEAKKDIFKNNKIKIIKNKLYYIKMKVISY